MNYVEMIKAIDQMKKLKAPIYAADVECKHVYNAFVEKALNAGALHAIRGCSNLHQ